MVCPLTLDELESRFVTVWKNGHMIVSTDLVKKLWNDKIDGHLDDIDNAIKNAEEKMKDGC
jgi:hypothetical protein